jgi:hypothetical protein
MAAPVVDAEYLRQVDRARRDLRALISVKGCAPIMLRLAYVPQSPALLLLGLGFSLLVLASDPGRRVESASFGLGAYCPRACCPSASRSSLISRVVWETDFVVPVSPVVSLHTFGLGFQRGNLPNTLRASRMPTAPCSIINFFDRKPMAPDFRCATSAV